jgi:hypothetical protein
LERIKKNINIKYRTLRDGVSHRPINRFIAKCRYFRRWPDFSIKNYFPLNGFSPENDKPVIKFFKLTCFRVTHGKNLLTGIDEKDAGPDLFWTLRLNEFDQHQVDPHLFYPVNIEQLRIF